MADSMSLTGIWVESFKKLRLLKIVNADQAARLEDLAHRFSNVGSGQIVEICRMVWADGSFWGHYLIQFYNSINIIYQSVHRKSLRLLGKYALLDGSVDLQRTTRATRSEAKEISPRHITLWRKILRTAGLHTLRPRRVTGKSSQLNQDQANKRNVWKRSEFPKSESWKGHQVGPGQQSHPQCGPVEFRLTAWHCR